MSEYRNGKWTAVPLDGERRQIELWQDGECQRVVAEALDGRSSDNIVCALNRAYELQACVAELTAELARRQQQVETLRAACEVVTDQSVKLAARIEEIDSVSCDDPDVQVQHAWAMAFSDSVVVCHNALAATAEPGGDSWTNDGWDLDDDVRGVTNSTNATPTAPAPPGEE